MIIAEKILKIEKKKMEKNGRERIIIIFFSEGPCESQWLSLRRMGCPIQKKPLPFISLIYWEMDFLRGGGNHTHIPLYLLYNAAIYPPLFLFSLIYGILI